MSKPIVKCFSCRMHPISKDELSICKKMLGRKTENYFCLTCLADFLHVAEEDILDKIEQFKGEGCVLFK